MVETQGSTQTEPFNLAEITVGQNINEILKSAGATVKEAVRINEVTLIGNERLAFSSKELLHFNGIDLEGKNNKKYQQSSSAFWKGRSGNWTACQ